MQQGNPFYVTPLGGMDPGKAVTGMANQWQQNELMDMERTKFEQAMQTQEQMQALTKRAFAGDMSAVPEIYALDPTLGAKIDQGLGIQNEQQAKQAGGFLEKYLSLPKGQARTDFLQKTAGNTPFTIDDDLLAMDEETRDRNAMLAAGRYLNKEQLAMLQQPEQEKPKYTNIKRAEDGNLYGLNSVTQQIEQVKSPEGVSFGGDSGQTINVNTGANEQQKVIDKYQGDAFVSTQKQATDARKAMQNLNSLDALSEKAFSGAGAGVKRNMAKLAQVFGIEVEGLSETELFESVANELTLGKTAQMTGVLTDRDMEFLQSTVPQLNQTADGRKKLVKIAKKMAKRQIQYAKEAAQFRRQNDGVFNQYDFEAWLSEKNEGKDFLADFYPTDAAGVTDFSKMSDDELMKAAFGDN